MVEEFTDDASGATTQRPGLQRAIMAAKAGRYDLLLVYRLDRFTCRIRDLAVLMEELGPALSVQRRGVADSVAASVRVIPRRCVAP